MKTDNICMCIEVSSKKKKSQFNKVVCCLKISKENQN